MGKYFARMEQTPTPLVDNLAMLIPSNQDAERHVWLGMPAGFREWIGGRQKNKTRVAGDWKITNKDFESTEGYHERDRTEDKTGQLDIRIGEHAMRAVQHEEILLSQLLDGADAALCYDGQYYFDTDHSEGASGTQSNSITYDAVSTTAPTAGEMEAAILQAIQQQLGFKDDKGLPLNQAAKSFLVVVPTPFWAAARAAIGASIIIDASTSRTGLIKGATDINVTVSVNPMLTWTTKFATFRTDGLVKPFIQQVREPVTTDVLGVGSDNYFHTREILVSLKKAGNMGFGLWQGATLTTFT
jgi:phage major head subunit gpT-like protein